MSESRKRTSGGVELTDELIERLASEAEQGYDTTQLRPRRRGRPAIGSAPAVVFQVRLDPDLHEALMTAANDAGISPSELARRALRAYLEGPATASGRVVDTPESGTASADGGDAAVCADAETTGTEPAVPDDAENLAKFADGLRDLQRATGMTVRKWSKLVGLSPSTVYGALSGRTRPTWAVVSRILRAAGEDPAPWRIRWERLPYRSSATLDLVAKAGAGRGVSRDVVSVRLDPEIMPVADRDETHASDVPSTSVPCNDAGSKYATGVQEKAERDARRSTCWAGPEHPVRAVTLAQHLLDTAAAAEVLWDRYLSASVTKRIEDACGGKGRPFFVLMSALHDLGKLAPAWQYEVAYPRAPRGKSSWEPPTGDAMPQRRAVTGSSIVRGLLMSAGWNATSVDWVSPLAVGAHVPLSPGAIHEATIAQESLVPILAEECGVSLSAVEPPSRPSLATQLALSGAITMTTWFARCGHQFGGVGETRLSMTAARERAHAAWRMLGFRSGWAPRPHEPGNASYGLRFGSRPRPVQLAAIKTAEQMPTPGLIMIEAPAGSGKTQAALWAAEILSRRFGVDRVFVAMPRHAAPDEMYMHVKRWVESTEPAVPTALLHGGPLFAAKWRTGLHEWQDSFSTLAAKQLDPSYGMDSEAVRSECETDGVAASGEWLLGRHRGLLAPVIVGRVDDLLRMASRSGYVTLRHLGLAGRVVVLDHVQASAVDKNPFLEQTLRWLGDGGVPVVVLSTTLPPQVRESLAAAYLQVGTGRRDADPGDVLRSAEYPIVRSVCAVSGRSKIRTISASSRPESRPIAVEVLPEPVDGSHDALVELLNARLSSGGTALIVMNSAARAQRAYRALATRFSTNRVLLHSQLTLRERTKRARELLSKLGSTSVGFDRTNQRMIVVATQVVEAGLDIDVDLLISDIAPIDTLIQRVGRLHRHDRPSHERPMKVRNPRIVITGMRSQGTGAPTFPDDTVRVYARHYLLRTAALVNEAVAGTGWNFPSDVPDLVTRGYGDDQITPAAWRRSVRSAAKELGTAQARQQKVAESELLAYPDKISSPTLNDLHNEAAARLNNDASPAIVGASTETFEVVLVRRSQEGYLTLDGRSIEMNGEVAHDPDLIASVLQATITLPANEELVAAASQLTPLPAWHSNPWLAKTRALVLDEELTTELGGHYFKYSYELGLQGSVK